MPKKKHLPTQRDPMGQGSFGGVSVAALCSFGGTGAECPQIEKWNWGGEAALDSSCVPHLSQEI